MNQGLLLKFQVSTSNSLREVAITSILYNKGNPSIIIFTWGLKSYILYCLKESYYIHEKVSQCLQKQKEYENSVIHLHVCSNDFDH